MQKLLKILPVVVALVIGSYLGYYFTNSHYVSEEAKDDRMDSTAICRLELREGNRGDVKEKYIALLEYRTGDGGREFCEKHTPTDSLPDDTNGMSLDSLYSDEDYNE